jgi:hypothetical protein
MPITALPEAPSTSDPANFATEADAFVAALALFRTEANALEVAADADAAAASGARAAAEAAALAAAGSSTLVSTCSTSVTLSNAAKALTIQSGRTFVNGQRATLIRVSDPTSQGSGIISAFSGGTTLTLTIDNFIGPVGPFTDWLLVLSVFAPLPAATTADIRTGTFTAAALTPAGLYNAAAEVTLTDAATIAVDMNTFQNAVITLTDAVGSSRVLGAPSNAKPGQSGRIRVIQSATGSRLLTYHANWKREGGAGPLSTAANAVDYIYFDVITPTLIVYNLVRAPS